MRDRRAVLSFAVGALVAVALCPRLSRAAQSPGEVRGTLTMTDRVKERAGVILVFLEPEDGAAISANPKHSTIKQRDAHFVPPFLAVAQGDTVDFVNDEVEDLQHNVYSFSDAKSFDLGLFGKKADQKSVVFDKSGEVDFFCSIHKFMSGTIYVAPTPYFAPLDAQRSFDLTGVPAGEWKATAWCSSKRYSTEEQVFTVSPGGVVELKMSFGRRQ